MADIEKITHIGLVPAELINDLRQIIDSARSHVAATANYEVTMMNWNIGNRINRDVLNYERAEYGKQIVAQLATKLSWSHFIEVLPLKEPLQREFYLTMAAAERWSRMRCNRVKSHRLDYYCVRKEARNRQTCFNWISRASG